MDKFLEYLEELADLKINCSIKFKADNGGVSVIQSRLRDINTKQSQGYIQTAEGLKINISQLIEVNGRQPQNFC